MFDFEEAGQRKRVEAILAGRINESCLQKLYSDDVRARQRSACIQVVCMVPSNELGWDYEAVSPVVSRDISLTGLSILHREPIDGPILLESPSEMGSRFVRCEVQHCNDLGHGYFHIGLSAREVVNVEAIDRNRIERRVAEFADEATASTA